MITKFQAIRSLRPTSSFEIDGDIIRWLDANQSQPSDAEIEAEVARLTALEPARIATENRRAAYISEADPIFFKAQRGEATQEEWLAKIEEIKERFPKPE